jgi:hypothetical protein
MPTDSALLIDEKGRVEAAFDSTGRELEIQPGFYLELRYTR